MKNYSESEIRAHYRSLTKLLIERGLTITTMESATSGQIASLITDTEGSSAVLKGAFVTYSNEAKIQQGVPASILEKYTVYSLETAEAMAAACMKAYKADIGIGVTGTMGNVDPANPEASVPGQVYFAIGVRACAGRAAGGTGGGDKAAEAGEGAEFAALAGGADPVRRVAGPGEGNCAVEPAIESFYIELEPQPSRLMYKLAVAEEVYQRLMALDIGGL